MFLEHGDYVSVRRHRAGFDVQRMTPREYARRVKDPLLRVDELNLHRVLPDVTVHEGPDALVQVVRPVETLVADDAVQVLQAVLVGTGGPGHEVVDAAVARRLDVLVVDEKVV